MISSFVLHDFSAPTEYAWVSLWHWTVQPDIINAFGKTPSRTAVLTNRAQDRGGC